jgi:hypothetical protein
VDDRVASALSGCGGNAVLGPDRAPDVDDGHEHDQECRQDQGEFHEGLPTASTSHLSGPG